MNFVSGVQDFKKMQATLRTSLGKSFAISGQSYKQFTLVNYNSRVVPDLKTLHIMTLGS